MLPVRTRRATRRPRAGSPAHTPPENPYGESLATATASSSSSQGMRQSTGPKISSRATRMELSTSAEDPTVVSVLPVLFHPSVVRPEAPVRQLYIVPHVLIH